VLASNINAHIYCHTINDSLVVCELPVACNPNPYLASFPDPTSHEEKGLVAIERFLGCA